MLLACSLCACNRSGNHGTPSREAETTSRPSAPYTGKTEPDDGQWIRPAKDLASTRFSGLDQINSSNVGGLKLDFTFSTGQTRGHEAAPLIVNGTMYIVTPWPNELFALDLTQPGAPLKWEYNPHPSASAKGVACCDWVNRGAVYGMGKIFYNTLDNYTVAVDAASGKEVWKTKLGDINKGESMTMAPLLVKDKVLVGNSGGEFGVRGWLTALDANSGKVAWRAYSTGPDKDVLIGASFHPFYAQDRGADLGTRTWPPDAWKIGGGTVWGWISYDPELDLVYYGTANPGPWNADVRPGDNKWTAGIFARRPETGEAVWFYQFNPHDLYDYDGVNENLLLDLPIKGQSRKVLVHPDRNGYMYVLDRQTGELLSAEPFAYTNTVRKVDLHTGLPEYATEKAPRFGAVVREICPTAPGGKDWQPSAYSPRTGLMYVPHNHLCMDWESVQANYISGTPYVGANVRMYPKDGWGGEFSAWDPVQAKAVWTLRDRFPFWSGALATAGDVVFFGTMDGWFKAVDARSGKELWKFHCGSGVIGQPVSYRSPLDGKQHIAVLSGVGGWAGAIVSGGLDARDETGALGFVGAVKDLPKYTTKGGMLYDFSL